MESVPAGLQVEGVVLVHFLETDGAAVVFSVDTGTTSTPLHELGGILVCFAGHF